MAESCRVMAEGMAEAPGIVLVTGGGGALGRGLDAVVDDARFLRDTSAVLSASRPVGTGLPTGLPSQEEPADNLDRVLDSEDIRGHPRTASRPDAAADVVSR